MSLSKTEAWEREKELTDMDHSVVLVGWVGGEVEEGMENSDGKKFLIIKWNKPGGEGQIPYDLTFNWNIINRREKQTKYNQRHWS